MNNSTGKYTVENVHDLTPYIPTISLAN